MSIKSKTQYPKGLPFLFLTEMWERFGFYVVQGMLVLYMTKAYGFSDDQSYTILGVFTALAYISPMVGGFLADHLLGFKQAIVWGGFFLSAGYALLAVFSWMPGFYFALATIIVGNGLFKPNISSLLGALYGPGVAGRDVGFTIFYIGINLGVLLAGLSSGFIKDHFGWHAGFALACIGLLFGLSIFALGIKKDAIKYDHSLPVQKNFFLRKSCLIVYCFIAIPLIAFFLGNTLLSKWFFPTLGVVLLAFVFGLAYKQAPLNRNRLLTLNILIISSVIFWAIYWQMFFSVTLFIDRIIDKQVFGITVPTTVFYTLESIFVILSGPILVWLWQLLDENQCNPSSFIKFVLGIFSIGLAFLVLWLSTKFLDINNLVSPLWIVLSYFLITLGEMLISPIGLSAVTMLSPVNLTGMMMGIWFVALGFGGQLAGWLAKWSSVPESANTIFLQLPYYRAAFLKYALLAFGVTIILFIIQSLFKKSLLQHET
ncbi:MAG: peptide MFS transporter [Gammaproteobacteria bacterium]|nr:peptide MFS transporter [Gammaproteobacteria bacterium]